MINSNNIYYNSNGLKLKLPETDYSSLKQRLQKVKSSVSLQSETPFQLNQDTWRAKRNITKIEMAKTITQDNQRMLQRLHQIINDQKPVAQLNKRNDEHDHILGNANQQSFSIRKQRFNSIKTENQRIYKKLIEQKSSYSKLPELRTPRGQTNSSKPNYSFAKQPCLTTRSTHSTFNQLPPKEKDIQRGVMIERQASKLLKEDRQVIFKKTVDISLLSSFQGVKQKLEKPFLVEISISDQDVFMAAYDLTSDENFLLKLEKTVFDEILVDSENNFEKVIHRLKIENSKLKIRHKNNRMKIQMKKRTQQSQNINVDLNSKK